MSDAAFWDKIAPKYAKDPISDLKSYNVTLDRIKAILQPHHRVLEIGCGTGSTALQLADGVDRYIGTDVSGGMIAIAQDKLSASTPDHLRFATHAAEDMPAAPHDVILALNLLHLVPNMEEVLDRAYEALPSGGVLITKTPLLKDGMWFLRPMVKLMKAIGKAPFVSFFTGAELKTQMGEAGFEIIETLDQPGLAPRIFTVARKP